MNTNPVNGEGVGDHGPYQPAKNTIEYILFLDHPHRTTTRSHLAALRKLRRHTLKVVDEVTNGYIWHRGEFNLEFANNSGYTYLRGITEYGDSVDDEWLVVFILRELTKKMPGLWVHVSDSDGEFLLIEAANAAPNWINPEVDQNRVWIYEGKIYLIPLSSNAGWEVSHKLSLVEAFGLIQMHPVSVVHFPDLEVEAFSRLANYPEQITSCEYHCLLRLPRKLAYILHLKPKSIAPAIAALYVRELLGLRAITQVTYIPRFPAHDLVTTSVRFTKTLFAQLRSQQFTLPPAWGDSKGELRSQGSQDGSSVDDERLDLGMKATVGFELFIINARDSPNRMASELATILSDIEEGKSALPTDDDIMTWENSTRQDDDRWLDIDYYDLQAELNRSKTNLQPEDMSGFGDSKIHADLRRIVTRFQDFLQNDVVEFDGVDDIENDDDLAQDSDDRRKTRGEPDDASDGDKERYSDDGEDVIFDKDELQQLVGSLNLANHGPERDMGQQFSLDMGISNTGKSQYDGIRMLGCAMEAELKSHGALRFDDPLTAMKLMNSGDIDEPGGEIKLDYRLASNILGSFTGQSGGTD